jgi:hypothetical protein
LYQNQKKEQYNICGKTMHMGMMDRGFTVFVSVKKNRQIFCGYAMA